MPTGWNPRPSRRLQAAPGDSCPHQCRHCHLLCSARNSSDPSAFSHGEAAGRWIAVDQLAAMPNPPLTPWWWWPCRSAGRRSQA